MILTFKLNTTRLDRALDALIEGGPIRAHIYNDAQSPEGTYYWIYINNGRGPVRPVKAKVLHWLDAQGKDVFAMYAKGVPPTHIRENSIAAVQEALIPMPRGPLSRATIVGFVNSAARLVTAEMESRTPVRTGKLKSSYRIEEAEGENNNG